MTMKAIRLALYAATLTLGTAVLSTLHAGTYQFIISGYPAANESYPAQSDAVSFATGTLSASAASQGLEARYRTWFASEGAGLLSTQFKRFMLIVR